MDKKPNFALDLSLPEIRKRIQYAEVGPDVGVTVFDHTRPETKLAAIGKWIIEDGRKIFRVSIDGSNQDWTSELLEIRLQELEKK